jgi:hypothetical protein
LASKVKAKKRKKHQTTFECWVGPDDLTFSTAKGCKDMRARGLISSTATLSYSFQANTWTEAMTEHHRRQDWAPYVPFDNIEE